MPVQSFGHSHYWAGAPSTVVAPPNLPIAITSGYPSWQGGTIVASLFGGVGARLSHAWAWLRWVVAFVRRVMGLAPRHRDLYVALLAQLEAAPASDRPALDALRLAADIHSLPDADRAALGRAVQTYRHPAWPLATAAVRQTATTLGFNRPEAWIPLNRMLKHDTRSRENLFRHLEACRIVRANLVTSTLSNPDLHLLVELAYHRYRMR